MPLAELAALIRERNETETRISAITGRPASIGHIGEFIATQNFDIRLVESPTNKAAND